MKVNSTCSYFPRPVAGRLAIGLLCCLLTRNQHAQIVVDDTTATSVRGAASVVSGTMAGNALSLADSSALSATGGAQEASVLEENLSGVVSAEDSHAATIGQRNATSSEASAGSLSFTSCSDSLLGGTTIKADFVMSRAQATCSPNGPTASGQMEVSGLVVNGQSIAVSGGSSVIGLVINGQNVTASGQANQMILLPNGSTVIINEQTIAQTATTADITVNALHVIAPCASADVIVGSASAGTTCGSESSQITTCGDFVTGGGWITGTPSGARANFGAAGGIKDGAYWGHLNYIDHGNGMHVEATAVTGYAVDENDPDCRIIDCNVTIDDQPGTARVRVCDKGEPGLNDIFDIELSNGYRASGDLGGSRPGGGNIQVHKCS